MNAIVNLYLSVSNQFGTQHANWFDYTLMVVGWWVVCMFCLWAAFRPLNTKI